MCCIQSPRHHRCWFCFARNEPNSTPHYCYFSVRLDCAKLPLRLTTIVFCLDYELHPSFLPYHHSCSDHLSALRSPLPTATIAFVSLACCEPSSHPAQLPKPPTHSCRMPLRCVGTLITVIGPRFSTAHKSFLEKRERLCRAQIHAKIFGDVDSLEELIQSQRSQSA